MKKNEKLEKIRAFIRVRPISNSELEYRKDLEEYEKLSINIQNDVITLTIDNVNKNYTFDFCFKENSNQKQIFDISGKEIVEDVFCGYNGTIFCYGQTGSGKTYTMIGNIQDEEKEGIVFRSCRHLFKLKDDFYNGDIVYKEMINGKLVNSVTKEQKSDLNHVKFKVCFVQIYLENLNDLLDPNNDKLKIREDSNKGVYLDGVTWADITSLEDCKNIYLQGEKNRITAKTLMNTNSSRSHAILIIQICTTVNGISKISYLNLIDLAGSERVSKTGAENLRLEEAKKINFSLLALGNCISTLSNISTNKDSGNSSHVNYRDSKLTRLLQDSLGGNTKTAVIVNISPSEYNYEESISTILFGQRSMNVMNKPNYNIVIDYKELYFAILRDNEKLNDEINLVKNSFKIPKNNKPLEISNDQFELIIEKKASSNSKVNSEELEAFYSELMNQKDTEILDLKDKNKILEEAFLTFESDKNNCNCKSILKEDKNISTGNDLLNSETISIFEDLYSSDHDNWNIFHFEEALKCLNDDNLTLNDQIKDLKNQISTKNFESLRIKDINNTLEEKCKKITSEKLSLIDEIENLKNENLVIVEELKGYREYGADYKKISLELKKIFDNLDIELKKSEIEEKLSNKFMTKFSSEIKIVFKDLQENIKSNMNQTEEIKTKYSDIFNSFSNNEIVQEILDVDNFMKKQKLKSEEVVNKEIKKSLEEKNSNKSINENNEMFFFQNYTNYKNLNLIENMRDTSAFNVNNSITSGNPLEKILSNVKKYSERNNYICIEMIKTLVDFLQDMSNYLGNEYSKLSTIEGNFVKEKNKSNKLDTELLNIKLINGVLTIGYRSILDFIHPHTKIINDNKKNKFLNDYINKLNSDTNSEYLKKVKYISKFFDDQQEMYCKINEFLQNPNINHSFNTSDSKKQYISNLLDTSFGKSNNLYKIGLGIIESINEMFDKFVNRILQELQESNEKLLIYIRKEKENSGKNNRNIISRLEKEETLDNVNLNEESNLSICKANNECNTSLIKSLAAKDEEILKLQNKINELKNVNTFNTRISTSDISSIKKENEFVISDDTIISVTNNAILSNKYNNFDGIFDIKTNNFITNTNTSTLSSYMPLKNLFSMLENILIQINRLDDIKVKNKGRININVNNNDKNSLNINSVSVQVPISGSTIDDKTINNMIQSQVKEQIQNSKVINTEMSMSNNNNEKGNIRKINIEKIESRREMNSPVYKKINTKLNMSYMTNLSKSPHNHNLISNIAKNNDNSILVDDNFLKTNKLNNKTVNTILDQSLQDIKNPKLRNREINNNIGGNINKDKINKLKSLNKTLEHKKENENENENSYTDKTLPNKNDMNLRNSRNMSSLKSKFKEKLDKKLNDYTISVESYMNVSGLKPRNKSNSDNDKIKKDKILTTKEDNSSLNNDKSGEVYGKKIIKKV